MRFVLYNVRYGTGSGIHYHLPVPYSGCLRRTEGAFLRIAEYVAKLSPDIVGLVEADLGSFRQNGCCQPGTMASKMGGTHFSACQYRPGAALSRTPLLKSQGNAVVTKLPVLSTTAHSFRRGIKRSLLEVEFDEFILYLVHLSLGYRVRTKQIAELAERCAAAEKPMIVAGDGNTYAGRREFYPLIKALRLRNANAENLPTYPSSMPTLPLDFVLYSRGIVVDEFRVPRVRFSDHLPVVCDFRVLPRGEGRTP